MAAQATIKRLAKAKLASSGLTLENAEELGIEAINGPVMAKLFPSLEASVPALKLNYYDLNGKIRKNIFRVRLLETVKGPFGTTKDMRYMQPPKTPPAAYFPTVVDWKEIAKDSECRVIITEGELKAACVAENLGEACIGLGGVSNWASRKRGWDLLPELQRIKWEDREVVVVFDADSQTNPNVNRATHDLVSRLRKEGAKVK